MDIRQNLPDSKESNRKGMENMDISKVIFHLRDIKAGMVDAWQEEFAPYSNTVKVRKGE